MKKLTAATLALFLFPAGLLWAGDLRISGDTKVPLYRMARLSADGVPAGSVLLWDVAEEEKIDADEGKGRLVFTGPAGQYHVKLRAIVIEGGQAKDVQTARVVVTIGAAPGPGPGPDPPPGPADPLTDSVMSAWKAEADPNKFQASTLLAEVYRAGATASASAPTWADLFAVMAGKAKNNGAGGRIMSVQKVLQADALRTFPASGVLTNQIDPASRSTVAAYLGKVAGILEGLR